MEVLVVPLLGPFHLSSPAYNAVTVRDLLAEWAPTHVATTALAHQELAEPRWRDTPEIALPLAVEPWSRALGLPLHGLGEPEPEEGAEEDFRRYLEPFPAAMRRMREIDGLLQPVRDLLARPLTPARIERELLPALAAYQHEREAEFGDGPATGWLRERVIAAVERLSSLDAARLALLAPVEQIPPLGDELARAGAAIATATTPAVTPEARERALLDHALRGEAADPARLIAQLREIAGAEARYHEANLLLAGGHGYEALELLERTSRGDFSRPYFLPGYLLARLGQLRDLDDDRVGAMRAYRGVLALDYAPREAIEAAVAGLDRPFTPE